MRKLIFLFLLLPCSGFGQTTFQPDWSFNTELQLPVAFTNKAFKTIMQGLINVEPSIQYTLPNSLSFAVGGKYSFFTVNEFKITEKLTGGMHSLGGWVKIGREKFHSDRFATDVGMKIGYTENIFATTFYEQDPKDVNKKIETFKNNQSVGSLFFEPTLGFILTADERNAYRFTIGYNFSNFAFAPTQLGIASNSGYDAGSLSKRTSYLIVGFGYTLYFGVPPEEN